MYLIMADCVFAREMTTTRKKSFQVFVHMVGRGFNRSFCFVKQYTLMREQILFLPFVHILKVSTKNDNADLNMVF